MGCSGNTYTVDMRVVHLPQGTGYRATMTVVTPSFLSLSRAPCRKSLETSSFSSNHMMTNGSNQLQKEKERTETGSGS